jgi:hypothetical protein
VSMESLLDRWRCHQVHVPPVHDHDDRLEAIVDISNAPLFIHECSMYEAEIAALTAPRMRLCLKTSTQNIYGIAAIKDTGYKK